MILLTNEDGEVIGKFLDTKSAYANCYAMLQLTPEAQVWSLDVTPLDKAILAKDATEWMVVKIDRNEPTQTWVRPISEARSVMFQKHSTNNNSPRIRYRMFKPVCVKRLLKAIQFPAVKAMAIDKIERFPRVRLSK